MVMLCYIPRICLHTYLFAGCCCKPESFCLFPLALVIPITVLDISRIKGSYSLQASFDP